MQSALKVKIKTLIDEAHHIRLEERRHMLGNARSRKRLARDIHFRTRREGLGPDAVSVEELDDYEVLRLEKKLARSRARLSNPQAINNFNSLRHHRTKEVRSHARSCFLAYGFIRGYGYGAIETKPKVAKTSPVFWPDWDEVRRLIEKFSDEGTQAWEQRFNDFKIASGFVPKA